MNFKHHKLIFKANSLPLANWRYSQVLNNVRHIVWHEEKQVLKSMASVSE